MRGETTKYTNRDGEIIFQSGEVGKIIGEQKCYAGFHCFSRMQPIVHTPTTNAAFFRFIQCNRDFSISQLFEVDSLLPP